MRPVGRAIGVVASALSVAAALAACTSSSGPRPSPGPSSDRPNIVFVLTDDLASNLVPYMPHLQGLIQSGTSFANYFVVDSLSCPSRSAIFTGQYPHDNGVLRNSGAAGGYDAYRRHGDAAKSFAVALHAAGYRTGFLGNYLTGYRAGDPPPPGWDTWDGIGNGYAENGYDANENADVRHYGHDPADYLTDVLSKHAVGFIQDAASSGTPFALEIATFAPHRPWVPAPRDAGTYPLLRAPRGPAFDRPSAHPPAWLASLPPLSAGELRDIDAGFRARVESVQAVDRLLGTVQQALASTHEERNTYVVFSSDNGLHMGEHRLRPGKQTAFDTDIRVPLVVGGPQVRRGATVSAFATSIDLAPTLLQIGGARPNGARDGVSLFDLLHGSAVPPDWQRGVLIEHSGPVSSPTDPDQQSRLAGMPPSYEAMRTATSLYVEYGTGEREYYDLARDPGELDNLAGTLPASRLAQLHRRLVALERCHGAPACQRAAQAG